MPALLDGIDSPEQLRRLSVEDLEVLSRELRERIISVVSETGGHLASSLGVVELTVALHTAFDTPRDILIWDVGHQSYAHKILTGRRARFGSLRQDAGISGFPKRSESPYDAFGTGHASTSISAALGFAVARDRNRSDHRVITVVGDGALTGGLAYEGLNNAGASGTDIIVVLNDNRMSISPNVGAISRYLTSVITNPAYNRIRNEIWNLTWRLSSFGASVRVMARRLEESMKNLITPGMLFEELGFRYIGPVDGHNVRELLGTFGGLKGIGGPILVHVITKKGKGYGPAETSPHRFHGVSAFDKVTGRSNGASGLPSYTAVFSHSLNELAGSDERIVAVTAAMPDGTGLASFARKFPDRFFDVGIAEGHAVTFSAGMACSGLRPVVAVYSTFLQRALDQIIHDVSLQSLPIIFVLDRGGLVGQDGITHHGVFDLVYLSMVPNMIVSSPKDAQELENLLLTALRYEKGPFSIRFPRDAAFRLDPPHPPEPLPVGSWEVIHDGKDVAFLAVGSMVKNCLEASELLAGGGLSPGLVNCRFVKPVDEQLLGRIVKEYRILVTVEEGVLYGGFGSHIAQALFRRGISNVRLHQLGLPDSYIDHASRDTQLRKAGLSPEGIARTVTMLLPGRDRRQERALR
jgi:1-deoxy-D-xylulose-5-phosphate synthase